MSRTFTEVIERVKQLSLNEKQQLLALLNGLLIQKAAPKAKTHVPELLEPRPGLAKVVSQMPADHQTTAEGFGEPVGKEEW